MKDKKLVASVALQETKLPQVKCDKRKFDKTQLTRTTKMLLAKTARTAMPTKGMTAKLTGSLDPERTGTVMHFARNI